MRGVFALQGYETVVPEGPDEVCINISNIAVCRCGRTSQSTRYTGRATESAEILPLSQCLSMLGKSIYGRDTAYRICSCTVYIPPCLTYNNVICLQPNQALDALVVDWNQAINFVIKIKVRSSYRYATRKFLSSYADRFRSSAHGASEGPHMSQHRKYNATCMYIH
jgi:hypothetical protein